MLVKLFYETCNQIVDIVNEMLEGDKLIEQERVNVTLVGGITELSFIYE
jgi:hypothetical protein